MKKNGFTLVELLVVVSIIAILSVIGITIFASAQKTARDARRKSDVDAIAKTAEVHFGETKVGEYAPLKGSHFSSGQIPKDPLSGSSSCKGKPCMYCDRSEAGSYYCSGNIEIGDSGHMKTHGSDSEPGYNFWYWTWDSWPRFQICTNLESGSTDYYCRSSQQ